MEQTTLKLHHPAQKYNPEDFFVSLSNQGAFSLLGSWPNSWGVAPYPEIVLLQGPSSSGKTSLAHIWQQKSEANFWNPDSNSEDFDSSKTIIVDDCHQFDEEIIFHIFNFCAENKKHLLLISCENWHPSLKDLASRINSIKTVRIHPPDDDILAVFITSEFSKRSITIQKEVLSYLKYRVPRNYKKIAEIIEKIDDYCLAHQHKVTIPIARYFI